VHLLQSIVPFFLLLISFVSLGLGCAISAPKSGLPAKRELVREPLIIHADFSLPRNHELIDELVARADDVSAELEIAISTDPIHVFLFANKTDFRNYLAQHHPNLPDRRAFFIKTETARSVYAYWSSRVAEDLRHELTHAYLHGSVAEIPLWLDEGIAEYFETPRGLDGIHSPHIRLLAESFKSGQWQPNLARLEQIDSVAGLSHYSQLDYAESWLWVHFLLNSDAQTNRLICNAIDECGKTGTPPKLSADLDAYLPNWEQALIGHLKVLADGQ
jgi:hypothetical protein